MPVYQDFSLAYGIPPLDRPNPKVIGIPDGFTFVEVKFSCRDLVRAWIERDGLFVEWSCRWDIPLNTIILEQPLSASLKKI